MIHAGTVFLLSWACGLRTVMLELSGFYRQPCVGDAIVTGKLITLKEGAR